MRDKKANRYSYVNHDSRESKFFNKNFNKTNSYHTNFSGAKFLNTSLIGAKFKFCGFYGAEFDNCYIRGSLFRKCNLENSVFKSSIISASIFENCKLKGCRFEHCKIVASAKIKKILPEKYFTNTEFFERYPDEAVFNPALTSIVEALRVNDFIRRSTILHRKERKLDTVSLKVLVDIFGEEFLINHLEELPKIITNDFHTLSYITRALHKILERDRKNTPGPAALGAPKLTNDCSSTD